MNTPSKIAEWMAKHSLTRKQRLGILVIVFLNASFLCFHLFLPSLVYPDREPLPKRFYEVEQELLALQRSPVLEEKVKLNLFPFNPNEATEEDFKRLQFPERLIRTLLNYRNKGGRWITKQSMKKMWGLTPDLYHQIEPFIQLPDSVELYARKTYKPIRVDIATADTTALISLPCIGSFLAQKIIAYRESLGGFHQEQQFFEVYGIQESCFTTLREVIFLSRRPLRKINLNEATYNEINAHPYLRGDLAKQIVEYRKSKDYHLEQIEEIRSLPGMNDELFRKIVPYIILQ